MGISYAGKLSAAQEAWNHERERANKAEANLRQELETAWLRGYAAHARVSRIRPGDEAAQEAADYAERVAGGSTRPERPA